MGRSVTRPLFNIREYTTLFQKLRAKLRADFLTFWWFLDFDLRADVVQKFGMKKTLIILVLFFASGLNAKDKIIECNYIAEVDNKYFNNSSELTEEMLLLIRTILPLNLKKIIN